MKKFFLQNSLYITTLIAATVLIYTAFRWNVMPRTQRLIALFYGCIALHEWEELKFPGGFVELVVKLTGMPVKDMGLPKFLLFCLTIYMLLVPFCLPDLHWLLIAPLVLGIVEVIAHLATGRHYKKGVFYSPGMVTSLLLLLPLDVYTIYHIATAEHFLWWHWLTAATLLLIPLFGVQRYIIVHLMKMGYKEFVSNALRTITDQREAE